MTGAQADDARAGRARRFGTFGGSVQRLLRLAWPVFVGQLSVLAFGTIDTLLVARASAGDLAALAVGSAAYITVFIGFMGVLMALMPIVGQLHGAGRDADAGRQVHQAMWIAIAMAAIGSSALLFPHPFLALAHAGPEVADKVRGYLTALALSLPASLLFTVFRAFNNAVSRPKAAMALQLGGLAVKAPLSALLVFGVPALELPGLGVTGCGVATAVAMWLQALLAWRVLRRDPFYSPYRLTGRGLDRPDPVALRNHLRLGLPIGASTLVEVTGFAFLAIFISRLGATAVAGHQIAANLMNLLFMMPLALGSASTTLIAQRLGAGDADDARRLGLHALALGCTVAAVAGGLVFLARDPVLRVYTGDGAVIAAALPLLAWLPAFHLADAAQTIAAFVLRAYKVVTLPLLVYVAAVWGVGLGGGWVLAFDLPGNVPPGFRGATGYWLAGTLGLLVTGVALCAALALTARRHAVPQATAPAPSAAPGR